MFDIQKNLVIEFYSDTKLDIGKKSNKKSNNSSFLALKS